MKNPAVVRIKYIRKTNSFLVYLTDKTQIKRTLFIFTNDEFPANFSTNNVSKKRYNYFYLLKVLRNFGLKKALINLKDF